MAQPRARKEYKALSFGEKVAAIREVEKGLKKKSQIAKEFGIPPNTLSTYLKNKEKILNSVSKESGAVRKRARGPGNPDVDECVLKWLKEAREKKIRLSGTLIRAKAEEFGFRLGKGDFKASSGWLDGFKERNGISFKNSESESGVGAEEEAVNFWKSDLLQIIQGTPARNIFNVDETGLFYRCTPDKMLTFRGERCSGGKLSKERVTLLVGANMDGTEKLPLLMIGKSSSPGCLKNVKTMPVEYRANEKAWMTSEIFEKWLLEMDSIFYEQNRTILLFLDNCSAHNTIPPLKNVKVVFFPPNIESLAQPMDQGVMKNLKSFYRRLLVQNILSGNFLNRENKIKINVLEAARMCSTAWEQVTARTIARCFQKAGFWSAEGVMESAAEEAPLPAENWGNADPKVEAFLEEFIGFDENVATCETVTEDEILGDVTVKKVYSSSEEEDELLEELTQKPVPTNSEALNHLKEVRRFVEGQRGANFPLFQALDKLQEFVTLQTIMTSKKQLKIPDFFK